MWLPRTQNSIRIRLEVTSSRDNLCWDYVAIVTADFQPTEICVQRWCWWRHTSNRKTILPSLTDCLSGGRTTIKSGRDKDYRLPVSWHTGPVHLISFLSFREKSLWDIAIHQKEHEEEEAKKDESMILTTFFWEKINFNVLKFGFLRTFNQMFNRSIPKLYV